MSSAAPISDSVTSCHCRLIGAASHRNDAVESVLARIIASWAYGQSVLPQWLGLGELEFHRMLHHHFPIIKPQRLLGYDHPPMCGNDEEMDDLRKLLLNNRSQRSLSEHWLVEILIYGCLGKDHLWQDLGLWSRPDLSKLMADHFTPLYELNSKNMKWKKFLYKRLCETEGIYTCRAPSCEACTDYSVCFGPED
ncbi:MAG: nitrogen fixation protein NifQ [Candidatus Thiodiazotropha sp. (ex Ctena orbiculata)]|nr:nitrogen fixation protein NifQ [Candidatus Thiodiazotropha taylori]